MHLQQRSWPILLGALGLEQLFTVVLPWSKVAGPYPQVIESRFSQGWGRTLGREVFFSCWGFEEKSAKTPWAPALPAAEGTSALILKRESGKHHSIHYRHHLCDFTLLLYLLTTNASEGQFLEATYIAYHYIFKLPMWRSGKASTCQCRRQRFSPWIVKIHWSMEWQPTPVFLPGKYHGQISLEGYSPAESQRVRHDWVAERTARMSSSQKGCIKFFALLEPVQFLLTPARAGCPNPCFVRNQAAQQEVSMLEKLQLPLPTALHHSHYCLNHPLPMENCLPQNWSLVPKRWRIIELEKILLITCSCD